MFLVWRIRKRMALAYQAFMWQHFNCHVRGSISIRKGSCLSDKCPDILLCCGYCKYLEAKKCIRYDQRPLSCKIPPIDPIYIWLAGTKHCGFYWDKQRSVHEL